MSKFLGVFSKIGVDISFHLLEFPTAKTCKKVRQLLWDLGHSESVIFDNVEQFQDWKKMRLESFTERTLNALACHDFKMVDLKAAIKETKFK